MKYEAHMNLGAPGFSALSKLYFRLEAGIITNLLLECNRSSDIILIMHIYVCYTEFNPEARFDGL